MKIDHLLQPFAGIFRELRKREVINALISKRALENKSAVNIHRYDPSNIGDFYCGPHHYFPELTNKYLDISDYKREEKARRQHWVDEVAEKSLIVGGGGLLNRDAFAPQLKLFSELSKKGKKIVLWGAGHNSKSPSDFTKSLDYDVDLDRFGLVGVRDFGGRYEWVPCVSCLHIIFDTTFELKNEVGVVFHKKTLSNPSILKKFQHLPATANNAVFEDVVRFIGETDTVLTDSYHAMYWALMLGKKVLVFPNSSKFFSFKYTPAISTFEEFNGSVKKLSRYSGVLEECRTINLEFSKKVFEYLEL